MESDAAREQLERRGRHRRTALWRLGRIACEEPPEIPGHTRIADLEVVEVAVADKPPFVDEEPARNDSEAERRTERARRIDKHRELDPALLDDRPDPLRPLHVLGDGEEPEAPRARAPSPQTTDMTGNPSTLMFAIGLFS